LLWVAEAVRQTRHEEVEVCPVQRSIRLALLVLIASLPCAAFAQVDGSWTFGAIGVSDYRLDAVSSTDIFAGALGALDPTLNLTIGQRYQATTGPGHPLAILSKAGTPASDVALLVQGGAVGTLEADPGINWVDAGSTVTFTLTQNLADAMNASGIPGYRCNAHPTGMRGNFNIVTPPAIPILSTPAWMALAAVLLGAAAWWVRPLRRRVA
jgi:hypothetical protein